MHYAPMEPVLIQQPFRDEAWAFQPKWDGIRLITDGRRHYSKAGRELTAALPEVGPAVLAALAGQTAVLDGEFVVLAEGKPSFALTLAKLRGRPGLVGTYLVFDLLELGGQPLLRLPYRERERRLAEAVHPGAQLNLTPTLVGDGEALFRAIEAQGLEGIVAKRLDSPYLCGVKSDLWRKVKAWQEATFAVVGVTPAHGGQSLHLAAPDGSPVGRVFVSSRHGTGLRARVAFLAWTPDGRLRQPRFLGWAPGPDARSL